MYGQSLAFHGRRRPLRRRHWHQCCGALWFLVLDSLQGHPLQTSSVLGQVLLFGNDTPDVTRAHLGAVMAYTAVHFGAFLLVGSGLVHLARWARTDALVRYVLLQVFLAFEAFFYGLVLAAAESTRALFPFLDCAGRQHAGGARYGRYLWRMHPEFHQLLRDTPLGAAPVE